MSMPAPSVGQIKEWIDIKFGIAPATIHARTAFTLATVVGSFVAGRHSAASGIAFIAMSAGITVFPTRDHLERVYGKRMVAWTVFSFLLGVSLFFAAIFTGFALMADQSSFRSERFFWGAKIVSMAIAVPCWGAFYAVLGAFVKSWPQLTGRVSSETD